MSYKFYLDKVLCPVTPSKISFKINNKNKTMTLANDGEINILKTAGLTDVSFECLFPNVKYPFIQGTFRKAKYYLDKLEALKRNNAPFQFIVVRKMNNKTLYNTNIRVSLEDYEITEDADNGFDVKVSIKLKQYRDYRTKIVTIVDTPATSTTATQTTVTPPTPTVPVDSTPADNQTDNTYTVEEGDCLWNICKYFFGDGSLYPQLAELNGISNPDLIYPGQVLNLNING
ncbi:MAG: LysM peptidoglycan-binding protein [Clostridiaceae bacterium]|jgi:LysM repeat protein|nr:LysM peptidoglycan-binding protein [Clostridiaceae bacterium]